MLELDESRRGRPGAAASILAHSARFKACAAPGRTPERGGAGNRGSQVALEGSRFISPSADSPARQEQASLPDQDSTFSGDVRIRVVDRDVQAVGEKESGPGGADNASTNHGCVLDTARVACLFHAAAPPYGRCAISLPVTEAGGDDAKKAQTAGRS